MMGEWVKVFWKKDVYERYLLSSDLANLCTRRERN